MRKKKPANHPDRAPTIILCILIAAMSVIGGTHDWNNISELESQAEEVEAARMKAGEEQQEKRTREIQNAERKVKIATEAAVTGEQEQGEAYRYIKECPLSKKLQREIFQICAGANLSYELVMALIKEESEWNPSGSCRYKRSGTEALWTSSNATT